MSQALPWFRAYTKMVDDEKLRLLAFEDRWHFIAILCLKGQGVLDENDPLMMRKAAVKMGLDTRSLEEAARRLAEVGLIDRDTLQPHKWEVLQQRSDTDPTAADRKRRQRQREREEQQAANKANAEAQMAAADAREEENVTVTDVSRVTGHDVTRTDIDKEKDKDSQLSIDTVEDDKPAENATPAATPKATEKRATRLPDDWKLPKSWGDWALDQFPAMNAEAVRSQAEVFADYWRAKGGKDARKLDWLATWRNWIRRHNDRAPSAARPAYTSAPAHKYAAAARAIFGGQSPEVIDV